MIFKFKWIDRAVRDIGKTKGNVIRAYPTGLNSWRHDLEGGFIIGWDKWSEGKINFNLLNYFDRGKK